MKRDEIIRVAIERHMANFPANCKNAAVEVAELVAAAEREACAQACKQAGELAAEMYGDGAECLRTAEMCVEAIRARGQVEQKGKRNA